MLINVLDDSFDDTFLDQILHCKTVFKFNDGLFLDLKIHYLKFVCKITCPNYIQFFFVCQ